VLLSEPLQAMKLQARDFSQGRHRRFHAFECKRIIGQFKSSELCHGIERVSKQTPCHMQHTKGQAGNGAMGVVGNGRQDAEVSNDFVM
jgi:hypothetical protein